MAKKRSIRQLFGRRVRSLREALDPPYSQEDFANFTGLDRSHYGAIERGEVNATLEVVEVIALGLGVAVKELFEFEVC